MLTLIILFSLLPYLTIGAFVERRRYAIANHEYQASKPLPHVRDRNLRRIEEIDLALAKMVHKSYCHLNYRILKENGCQNCDKEKSWRALRAERANLKSNLNQVAAPSTNFLVVPGWPVLVLMHFLQGGTVRSLPKSNPDLIRELETLNKIGQ